MKLTGENRSSRRKTCPGTTLSTTNPTWTDLASASGGRPATTRLSHGTALYSIYYGRSNTNTLLSVGYELANLYTWCKLILVFGGFFVIPYLPIFGGCNS
jgi:hypothetical protein